MDTAYLKNSFKQEIDALSKIKNTRKRWYSPELGRAILKVHENGISLDKIRRDIGLGGGTFKCWIKEAPRSIVPRLSREYFSIFSGNALCPRSLHGGRCHQIPNGFSNPGAAGEDPKSAAIRINGGTRKL